MEVNNYQSFISYMKRLDGYQDYPVLLLYTQKKRDLRKEDYSAFKKIYLLQSYKQIDEKKVIKTCIENKCRCYVMVVDRFFLKVASKIALTTEAITEFLNEEIKDQSGLHLIDLDDYNIDVLSIINFLKEGKAKNIEIFPSRSGRSLVFYGVTELVKIYNELIGTENSNRAHNICALNLYIPNYYGGK